MAILVTVIGEWKAPLLTMQGNLRWGEMLNLEESSLWRHSLLSLTCKMLLWPSFSSRHGRPMFSLLTSFSWTDLNSILYCSVCSDLYGGVYSRNHLVNDPKKMSKHSKSWVKLSGQFHDYLSFHHSPVHQTTRVAPFCLYSVDLVLLMVT